ncbi:MFS transporter [Pseudoalteromonas sp. A22]|uniref:MFS transporter n=1 Tax=Pseudoalteromonas sp. A22 TaxID=327511 RepID=UPI001BA72EFB|nr:MFS transporter [Pseudoalteromonas sp. A22]QUI63666.1 MFS transporter [Pseudoalteromonas sp. A22]
MFSASMTSLASPKAKFGLCFVIHFLIALDALIIVPFSAEMALSSGTSPSNSGLLVSAYAIAAAFTCLWVRGTGNLSKEKYKVFIFLSATTLLTLLTSALESFYILLLVRALTGICGGALVVLNLNLVIQLSHENDKKKDTAILLSAFPLALAIGIPALLFITANQGWQLGFMILGSGLAITALLFTFIFLSNIKQASQSSASNPMPSNTFHPTKTLKYALFIAFFVVLSTFAISTQFPVMLITNLSISSPMLSACYLLSGVCSFIAIQLYARRKLNNHTTSYLIYFLSGLMILAALFGFTISSVVFAAGLFTLFVIASATRSMILVTELITSLHAEERSTFISLQNAIQHFAIASGGTIASLLVMPRENHTLNFNVLIVVSTLLVVITVVMWKNFQSKRF